MDVRSPAAGTLKAYHAAINDTVAVGSPLFTLDTSGSPAAASAAAPDDPKAAVAPTVKPAVVSTPPSPPPSAASFFQQQQLHRKPSIQFRHGGGREVTLLSPAAVNLSSYTPSGDYGMELDALYPSKAGSKPELTISPSFGRPLLEDSDESFMINSGGAFGKPPPPPPEKKGKK